MLKTIGIFPEVLQTGYRHDQKWEQVKRLKNLGSDGKHVINEMPHRQDTRLISRSRAQRVVAVRCY
jgi:hypothetical protein